MQRFCRAFFSAGGVSHPTAALTGRTAAGTLARLDVRIRCLVGGPHAVYQFSFGAAAASHGI